MRVDGFELRRLGMPLVGPFRTSFGTVTLASYGVGSNILQVVTIPALGLSMAVSTMVGQNMGAGQLDRAGEASIT